MELFNARAASGSRWKSLSATARPCERVLVVYFVYVALRGVLLSPVRPIVAAAWLAAGVLVVALSELEARHPRRWSSIARHWALVALILPSYWSLEYISGQPLELLQSAWLEWDRQLLDGWGLRAVIEAAGALGPFILETAYLLLYAIPPVSLGIVYAKAGRRFADRYLLILLLGTLAAYALIPLVPVISPRIAYPAADEPSILTLPRIVNVWLLDHLDNAVTVFPSGHVAVAFSSAFGLLTVFRRRAVLWLPAFILAALVYLATVYGRYHYFVDGLASIAITTGAWWSLDERNEDAA